MNSESKNICEELHVFHMYIIFPHYPEDKKNATKFLYVYTIISLA